YHFNMDRDYYECHEVMEELWLEDGRNLFYQGLLQIAVGLYHFRNDNVSGSIKLFFAGIKKLEHYDDVLLGINVNRIRNDSSIYVHKLSNYEKESFSFYDLNIEVVDEKLNTLIMGYSRNKKE
ncbi:MAG: DUF309 domain-containing protein, partial [Bacilli bacterium]